MNRLERSVGLLAARPTGAVMTVARSVADVLADHVVFEVESIDRMYLNVWQPRLAYGGGVQGFFVGHRGYHYASTALMDPMTKAFVADIHGFVAARGLELIQFTKGQRKDELTQQFLAKFTDAEGVLFVGRAQEKAGVWRTQRRYNSATGGSYAWLVRSSAFINFFYFYCVDADFGPFFLKFSTYFPYTAKLCINGNEWAKRQAAKAQIGFEPPDNGFSSCDDVFALQQICDSLGPVHIETTINDTRDFGMSKRLTNLPALRQIGFSANRRLLSVQRISHDPIRGAQAFTDLTTPIVTETGTRIPGLRFGDARVHALLQALLIHRLLPHGFTNHDLRTLIAPLLGTTPEDITAGKMTYDLRRLRAHGLIQRIPRSRRYQVTDTGLQQALLFTHAHDHLLRTGLAEITDPDPPTPSQLRTATRAYQAAFHNLARYAHLAA